MSSSTSSRGRTWSRSSGWCAASRSPSRCCGTRWCAASRPAEREGAELPGGAPDFIREWVSHGASVRAAQYLILGGKARALMRGRTHVAFEDIRALAHPVLRHRILTNFHAESERVTTDSIIDRLLEIVPSPRSGM
jgi:MoxR-like ATPase